MPIVDRAKMNLWTRRLSLLIFAIATVVAIAGGSRLLQEGKIWATKSTAQSICAAMSKEASQGAFAAPLDLTDSARYDVFISTLAKKYSLDAPAGVSTGKPLLDKWGNRFSIRLSEGGKHIEVISAGPDRQLQSADDVQVEWTAAR